MSFNSFVGLCLIALVVVSLVFFIPANGAKVKNPLRFTILTAVCILIGCKLFASAYDVISTPAEDFFGLLLVVGYIAVMISVITAIYVRKMLAYIKEKNSGVKK